MQRGVEIEAETPGEGDLAERAGAGEDELRGSIALGSEESDQVGEDAHPTGAVRGHPAQPQDRLSLAASEYVSALATSGANEQTAMALAHHSDSKVHRRYQIAQIRRVPDAALP